MSPQPRPGRLSGRALVLLAALTVQAERADAQAARADTVTVQAGPQYAAGGLHRFLFGTDYRSLWTVPIRVAALDLGAHGGLVPVSQGGGRQTKSLWFRGGDGYMYGFRSVDKDPSVLPEEFEGTFIQGLVSDQTSSQHPFAPSLAGPLMEALGLLHTEPVLVVLPDDARLGEFRERFAGTLGYFERRATVEPDRPGFAGALEIIGSTELLDRMRAGPADRADVVAFLTARLLDVYMGDWDRHRRQWTWARRADAPSRVWVPIPEDRDQAFARYDGVLLGLGRLAVPFVVSFDEEYGSAVGVSWNGRDIDRILLTPLAWATWDSVTAFLGRRLTDSVITAAVARLPAGVPAEARERTARVLRQRRDGLPAISRAYYELLARDASVHATDGDDRVTLERQADGGVRVTLVTAATGDTLLARTFDPAETHEIRLFLYQGADRVVARGARGGGITLRVIGGGGAAELVDSLGGVRLYATERDRAVGPRSSHVDDRADPGGPPPALPTLPYRDWGSTWLPNLWLAYGPDVGLFFGGGAQYTSFGFRKYPFAATGRVRAGYAFEAQRPRIDLDLTFHQENTHVRAGLYARASGIDVVRYHGLGNDLELTETDDAYYRVRQIQYTVIPAITVPIGRHLELSLGPLLDYVKTRTDSGRIIEDTDPYGAGGFGQLGGAARLEVDTRDVPVYATKGIWLRVDGRIYPAAWGVDSLYGFVDGSVSTYLTARIPLQPTLALRAGGRQNFGQYPFFNAAFIGDASNARLGRQNRYGGDAAVYGNAELRLRLTSFFVLLPGDLGIFGLADAGRVYLEGETSDTWHTAYGGGLWLSFLQHTMFLSAAIAQTSERTGVYIGTGMAF
jgi:hypothetical protein